MRCIVIGRGVSGDAACSLAEFLHYEVLNIVDKDYPQGKFEFKADDLVVVSPGVGFRSELFKQAQRFGFEIISELEFGFRHFSGRIGAVTGTNGKTTTTELLLALLKGVGVPAVAAGNIGLPLSSVAFDQLTGKLAKNLCAAVEVSSFQLEHCCTFAPTAAGILNIQSDHIDRYPGGLAEYAQVKWRIFDCVSLPQNRLYGSSMKIGQSVNLFSFQDDKFYFLGKAFLNYSECRLRGAHNVENILMALELLVRLVAVEDKLDAVAGVIRNFVSGEHRMEVVARRNGITYVNDSKATNPAAVLAALDGFGDPKKCNIRLILGGLDKDMDFEVLKLYRGMIKEIYIYGRCAGKLAECFKGVLPGRSYESFDLAVLQAKNDANGGDVVMMSPGCASMDCFKNYEERGKRFRQGIIPSQNSKSAKKHRTRQNERQHLFQKNPS
ncbi:MAG: UDP-N-acetylmuramoyl-L-alanine--D-glutamate ligase [Victivallaceae bacterium]